MRKIIKILVLSSLTIIGLSLSIFGVTITKTFEIGEGTNQPFSHRRTFEVPCNTKVSGEVYFSRMGRPGSENDVPLTITLTQPTADGGEGDVAETIQPTATTRLKSTNFSSHKSAFGCDKTWSVRVRTDEGRSGFTVKGEIRLIYSGDAITEFLGTIPNSSVGDLHTFNVTFEQGSTANPQGEIVITGNWDHDLYLLPIEMRAILRDPRGNNVAFASGYARKENNPCCSNKKLRLVYKFREHIPGTWTVLLTHQSPHKAVNVRMTAVTTPGCPQR